MKKLIYLFVLLFSVSIFTTSCRETKDVSDDVEDVVDDVEDAVD